MIGKAQSYRGSRAYAEEQDRSAIHYYGGELHVEPVYSSDAIIYA
jgi:hypothetical protein